MINLRQEFELGIEVETEHTQDRRLAAKIASDHLSEDPHYYSQLMSAGLVNEPEAQAMGQEFRAEIGDGGHVEKVKKNNSIEFGKTAPKIPAPSTRSTTGGLVNQTTGAKMGNQVSIDSGTTPLSVDNRSTELTPPVVILQVKSNSLADPTSHFIGQLSAGPM